MKFIKCDDYVTTIDSFNDRLKGVIKTIQNFFNEVFMIKWFPKGGKFVSFGLYGLHIVGDRL